MSNVIAIAGKGGTGKTTTTALLIRSLLKRKMTPILAIDADPNANLAESIGINVTSSIGSVLSDFLRERANVPPGMSKQAFLEVKLHQILKEGAGIDMMVMGTPEGPGCYCAANAMLKDYFDDLQANYKQVVVDNEAGMEHFSRKTTAQIDLLLFCSHYSLKGLTTVKKLSEMVDDLKISVKKRYLLVNRTPQELDKEFLDAIEKTGIPFLGHMPDDKELEEAELRGTPLTELPDSSRVVTRFNSLVETIVG